MKIWQRENGGGGGRAEKFSSGSLSLLTQQALVSRGENIPLLSSNLNTYFIYSVNSPATHTGGTLRHPHPGASPIWFVLQLLLGIYAYIACASFTRRVPYWHYAAPLLAAAAVATSAARARLSCIPLLIPPHIPATTLTLPGHILLCDYNITICLPFLPARIVLPL